MSDALSLAITLGCVATMLVAAGSSALGRFRSRRFGGASVVLESGLVVQAVLAIVGLLRGHRPAELSTFLAYLAFSLVLLPVAFAQVRGDAGRWAGAVLVVALLVQTVVVIRLQTSWRSA